MATRSPHRYNPIGLTLAKLERIEKNEIFVSSVDMISGTPILDIKPYHHLESIDINTMRYPEWIKNQASDEKKAHVYYRYSIFYSSLLFNFKSLKYKIQRLKLLKKQIIVYEIF